MDKRDKLQYLLIRYLLETGQVKLTLPDGMVLEIGITQEGKDGKLHKTENYCWMIATQKERNIFMDSYNLGLRFLDDKFLHEDEDVKDGVKQKILNII